MEAMIRTATLHWISTEEAGFAGMQYCRPIRLYGPQPTLFLQRQFILTWHEGKEEVCELDRKGKATRGHDHGRIILR